MADTCSDCGQTLGRFKYLGGHMENCPTLPENKPSKGAGRSPQYHTSEWKKSGRMDGDFVWRCTTCGTMARTDDNTPPAPETHRGKKT